MHTTHFVAIAKLDGGFLAKWVGQLQLNNMLENTGLQEVPL